MITLPFQRKKKEKSVKPPKKEIEKEKKVKKEKPVTGGKSGTVKKELGESSIAYRVLKSPLISEKITALEENNKYVFKVFKNANKKEIKKAIEDVYKTKVERVNIINIKRKRKRIGRIEGWRSGYKKAIVTLKKGEKIEINLR